MNHVRDNSVVKGRIGGAIRDLSTDDAINVRGRAWLVHLILENQEDVHMRQALALILDRPCIAGQLSKDLILNNFL